MKLIVYLVALVFIGVGMTAGFHIAHAEQGCPDGMMPNPIGAGGQAVCVPGRAQTDWSSGQQDQSPRWQTRWGAYALDDETSKVGVATGMPSKGKAKKEALAHCRSKGGLKCRLLVAYYNQCAAIAWGPDSTGRGDMIWANAPYRAQAEEMALQECQKASSACKVFFSECSYAELAE